MTTLVFLLEEPSARVALEGFLPKILPDAIRTRYLVFEGKQDLEKRMARQMRAWRLPEIRFVVLRDQDSGDCRVIKRALVERAREAGRPDALVRIACREFESWFVGDWMAVGVAFDKANLSRLQSKAMYREPDALGSPVRELRKVIPAYQKVDGARRIGPHLDPGRNRSHSFRAFAEALQRLVGGVEGQRS